MMRLILGLTLELELVNLNFMGEGNRPGRPLAAVCVKENLATLSYAQDTATSFHR